MNRCCLMLCILFVSLGSLGQTSARSDDADKVKEKLFEAKKAYDVELQKFKQSVEATLDKKEEQARTAGDKKAVDQIKIARESFIQTGLLPAALTPATKQQLVTARTNLDKAYAAAVKAYLVLKNDAAAEAIEKEQKEFRNQGSIALRPADVATKEDLHKYLINTSWDWGKMTFKADGSADVEWAGFMIAWDAVDRRTVVIRVRKGRDNDKVAVMTFNEEFTEFHGFGFGGEKLSFKRSVKR